MRVGGRGGRKMCQIEKQAQKTRRCEFVFRFSVNAARLGVVQAQSGVWQQGRHVLSSLCLIHAHHASFLCWRLRSSCMRLVVPKRCRDAFTAQSKRFLLSSTLEGVLKFVELNLGFFFVHDQDEWAKCQIWAVVPTDCAPRGEKYVTSECGCCTASMWKAPEWTLIISHRAPQCDQLCLIVVFLKEIRT